MKPFKIGTLVKALILTIPAYVLGLVVLSLYSWLFVFLWLIFLLTGDFGALPLIALPIALFAAGTVWYLITKFIYGWLLKVFWSEPPEILRPGGFKDGLKTCGEVFLVTLPIALVFATLAGFDKLPEISSREYFSGTYEYGIQKFSVQWFWLWLASAVSYYHFVRR